MCTNFFSLRTKRNPKNELIIFGTYNPEVLEKTTIWFIRTYTVFIWLLPLCLLCTYDQLNLKLQ